MLVSLLAAAAAFAPAQPRSFVGVTRQQQQSTELSMGLFDFFSEDARKERAERREREIEEQEKLQRQILERRADPAKMEDYQARVKVRRRAIMEGMDGSKIKVMVDDDDKEE